MINNIGVGTGDSNYFQPMNWNLQFFNYFILENNATKIKGRHEFQFGIHLRYDQLTYMPQQQRTAGSGDIRCQYDGAVRPRQSMPTEPRARAEYRPCGGGAYLGYAIYEVRRR